MTTTAAVIGAGIGGLTAAAELHRRGIDVHVYERGDAPRETGVGMHLGPNGTRLLARLGLGPELARTGVRPEALEVRALHDGSALHRQEMGARWEEQFGAPYLTIHRGDLHRALASLVPAARVHSGRTLSAVTETPGEEGGVVLDFADGSTARADVVIGADGMHSVLRRRLTGEERPVYSGSSALRGLVAAGDVPELDPTSMYMFAGPAARVLCYPVSGGREFTYVVVVPTPEGPAESWTSEAGPRDLAEVLEGCAPVLRRLAGAARDVRRWGLYDRTPLDRWSTARTTLLGDAAHPMLPHHGQGANQAIEDGTAIAVCLDEAGPGAAGIAAALDRYEHHRRPHTTHVQRGSRAGQPHRTTTSQEASAMNNNTNNNRANNANNLNNNLNRQAAAVGWVLNNDVEANLANDNNNGNNANNNLNGNNGDNGVLANVNAA